MADITDVNDVLGDALVDIIIFCPRHLIVFTRLRNISSTFYHQNRDEHLRCEVFWKLFLRFITNGEDEELSEVWVDSVAIWLRIDTCPCELNLDQASALAEP